jgi:hypothetical protein
VVAFLIEDFAVLDLGLEHAFAEEVGDEGNRRNDDEKQ